MHISTPSSQENTATERGEPTYVPRCPLCSGALIALPSAYRCTRCCYHHCVGCEPSDAAAPSDT
jgi:hypothetical protein